ncbi:MAG: ATP-binding protein [Proteobacteria bacterium]|nr:ATP-binding protein [Pseudomonadota bacterium]MBU1596313.1 ATP-binding protein [Pseudomonadota bacterium]
MIYAIASGKGGTGKTTVTASLAALWDRPVMAVDLDVEEPNLHLFLHPELTGGETALMEVPVVDAARCTLCGQCAAFCQFKALSVMGKTLLAFPEMCHGCGGCLLLCPEKALAPGGRELGQVVSGHFRAGRSEDAGFLMGRLRVGEAMSPPLMRQVKARLPESGAADILIDSPPGVSCPAVNAVMDADVIVLVTEPTPFGLHDFRLAVEAFRPLGKPLGAVVNRSDINRSGDSRGAGMGDSGVQNFCRAEGIPVWAEIPFSRAVAEAYSRGEVAARAVPEMHAVVLALMARMQGAAASQTTGEALHA